MTTQPSGKGYYYSLIIPAYQSVCMSVCRRVSVTLAIKYHTSYFNNTSQSHKCIENTSKKSQTVTEIPVTLPADVSMPLAAVAFGSSHLAAVVSVIRRS